MPYGNGVAYSRQLSESTQKLFKAIDDGNLENFKQALEEGAGVNAFDEEGITPLISIVNNLSAGSGTEKEYQNMIRLLLLHRSIDVNIREQNNGNTALHLAMCFHQKKTLQLLLSHPDIKTYLVNKEQQNPNGCAQQNRAEHLIIEIQKAQKGGKELLDALSKEDVNQAKTLLDQKLNPNCWRKIRDGRIKTPLSLIIRSCLRTITEDKKEVLTKLLKHKDLDFSYEQYAQLKQTIEQAVTERLADAIDRKDLDDVKKLVEDNDFMNYAIIIAALRGVNNPIESITNYLNEKFPANTNNIPKDFEGFVQELVDELERTKTQLAEKEQELTNKTGKISLRAISPGKKQSNYAYAFFILSGALTGCVGLAILYDYLVIGACLTAVALVLFLVGCHSLYKANTILSDVESTQLGGLERS